VNKSLTAAERDELRARRRPDDRLEPRGGAPPAAFRANAPLYNASAASTQPHVAWCAPTAPWTSTTAACAPRCPGRTLFDHFDYRAYYEHIHEEVKPWSYMKFPSSVAGARGRLVPRRPAGAGAELRLHPTPLAESSARPSRPSTAAAPARRAARLPLGAHDRNAARRRGHPDLLTTTTSRRPTCMAEGSAGRRRRRHRGAARHPDPPLPGRRRRPGELRQPDRLHHHNNQAMNEAVRQVARRYLDGRSSPRACSTTSRWPSAPSTPACPAPPTRWARCRSGCRLDRQTARSVKLP
jgi:hypothetical protein